MIALVELTRNLVGRLKANLSVLPADYQLVEAFLNRREAFATCAEIEEAREIHGSDEVELDPGAFASRGDDGFWVSAWVWVPKQMYVNYYCHEDCPVQPGVKWEDTHDSMCNDRCPACNAEIEPYDSEEL